MPLSRNTKDNIHSIPVSRISNHQFFSESCDCGGFPIAAGDPMDLVNSYFSSFLVSVFFLCFLVQILIQKSVAKDNIYTDKNVLLH